MKFGQGQKVIITGASTGIGRAIAKELAKAGAQVGLIARREELLLELVKEIQTLGGKAFYRVADISERNETVAGISELIHCMNGVDILIANAGVGAPTTIQPFNVETQEKMIKVNLLGVIYCIEAVLQTMLDSGKGQIVAISSLAGFKGLPGESGYTASKAGLNTFMEGMRIQLRPKNIYISTICPGFIKTPMTEVNDEKDMPWLMDAETAAKIIIKAIGRKTKVLRFPWQTSLLMRVTGILPDWVVERVMKKYNDNPPMPKRPL
jgi:short-subunit dehydrogenase